MSNCNNISFHNNPLYQLLANQTNYSFETVQKLNLILHEQPDLAKLHHPNEGSYYHIICQNAIDHDNNMGYRMIYALSNAGADPNRTNEKGNTPLHEAVIRGFIDLGLDFIQAFFRVGIDQRIVNKQGKRADAYLDNNPQMTALFQGYGEGVWAAVEENNIQEVERLVKGFIKFDCKHNDGEMLLEKARNQNRTEIIRIFSDHQVTIEFAHSILACDWDRAALIHQHKGQFIKINSSDSLHNLTWFRTTNRTYSKCLLEFCLDTDSSNLFDMIFNSPTLKSKININVLCTDGLPFYFHMFDNCFSDDIRTFILSNANFNVKSSNGDTILYHLIHLYDKNENKQYLDTFQNIIEDQPIILAQRNAQNRTILEEIQLTPTLTYNKLEKFYDLIKEFIINQTKNNLLLERYILNCFGYHLLLLLDNQNIEKTKFTNDLLKSFKFHQNLLSLIDSFTQAIVLNDLDKIKNILKSKSNICYAKDWSGRTCIHIAVLHRRRRILKFLCENCQQIINIRDNLNRTPLHYACIMNDQTLIDLLQQANAKAVTDSMSLFPNDYKTNRDLCCEEFHSQNFPKSELEKPLHGISDYLKLAFYSRLKESIEQNNIENIKLIHQEIDNMGFRLDDLSPNSYLNDWVKGQRYVPLLFVALEHRSIASFQYLMESGLKPIGRMYISKSINSTNSRCVSFRTRAEELECFDVIGMINDLEDDNELKNIFKRHLSPNDTVHSQSPVSSAEQTGKRISQQNPTRNADDMKQTMNGKSQSCIVA